MFEATALILRPFREDLITDQYIGWLNDKQLMRYSRNRHRTHTRESCLEYLRGFQNSKNFFWSVQRASDGMQIGTMTAYLDDIANTADIGILIGRPDARGKGLGRHAWGLAMRYLFEEARVRKVTGGAMETNVAMVRIFEHWGMVREAVLREQEIFEDKPVNIVRYGILDREWFASKAVKARKDACAPP